VDDTGSEFRVVSLMRGTERDAGRYTAQDDIVQCTGYFAQ
jgi:hypothetical protein